MTRATTRQGTKVVSSVTWTPFESTVESAKTIVIEIDPETVISAGADRRSSSIAVLLPSRPVNVYIDGTLVQKAVKDRIEFITPDLPEGEFTYKITIIDSADATRGKDFEIQGITAGKIIAVDLRSHI